MSLQACSECWDTLCTCGHQYRNWSVRSLEEQIKMLKKVLARAKKRESKKSGTGS